jgi:hypothetical protein
MEDAVLKQVAKKLGPGYFGLNDQCSLPLGRGMSNARLHGKGCTGS